MDFDDLRKRFNSHALSPQCEEDVADVRASCLTLASELNHLTPDCMEKSLAMTRLEEVMFWSNAAIARNQ